MIVQAINNTGARYVVVKCAEIVFEIGKMVKGEGFQMFKKRMKTMEPVEIDICRFLEIKQTNGIKMKEEYNKVKQEISRRMNMTTRTELNEKNLGKTANAKVIPVAAYPRNVCKFT